MGVQPLSHIYLRSLRVKYKNDFTSDYEITLKVYQYQLEDWFAHEEDEILADRIRALIEGNIDYLLGFKFEIVKPSKSKKVDLTVPI